MTIAVLNNENTILPVMYLPTMVPTGEIETATRYYITSLPYKKYRKMTEAIREHWQIENGLHYKLDVGIKEEQCTIYHGYSDRNLSIMRKIVLKLLTNEKSNNHGVALKRMKAALSVQYTGKVVGF